MQINVGLSFEASDMDAARDIVATWNVSPGTSVTSFMGTDHIPMPPTLVGADGNVGTAIAAANQASELAKKTLNAAPPVNANVEG